MINPINFAIKQPNSKNQINSINFCSRLSSVKEKNSQKVEKQSLPEDLFFISMKHYDKNKSWAQDMNKLAYELSDMISEKTSFDKIIKKAERGVLMAYFDPEIEYGARKCIEDKWKYFIEGDKKGEEYLKIYSDEFSKEDIYNKTITPKSNSKYKNANTCTIKKSSSKDYYYPNCYQSTIIYPEPNGKNLKLAKKEYKKLLKNKNPDINTILKSTAIIHWLLTQETPWKRGSASIANLITKSILYSYNIQISPAKEGKSFDFEAFYRNLDDFIEIYPDLFQTKPYIRQNTLV